MILTVCDKLACIESYSRIIVCVSQDDGQERCSTTSIHNMKPSIVPVGQTWSELGISIVTDTISFPVSTTSVYCTMVLTCCEGNCLLSPCQFRRYQVPVLRYCDSPFCNAILNGLKFRRLARREPRTVQNAPVYYIS